MPDSLANQFRPKTLSEVVGQPEAVSIIESWKKDNDIPHVVLLVGDSGTGKTTLSGLLTEMVGLEKNRDTYIDINAADDRSIDMARDVINDIRCRPLPPSKVKVVEMDEVVQLPEATQNALLDMLENPPTWAYFFLCTSKVSKLLKTFRSRCKVITLNPLDQRTIRVHMLKCAAKLPNTVYSSAIDKIGALAEGNMRTAFSMLETIHLLPNAIQQCRALESWIEEREDDPIGQLCRALLDGHGIMEARNKVTESPEGVRMRVLAYMNKVLCGGGSPRAGLVLDVFQYDWSQYGNQQQAGLTLCCWKCQARGGK